MGVGVGIGVRTPNFQSRRAQSAMTTALKIIIPNRPTAAEAPVPAAPSYPYLASYAVFLLSFASVRLLSSFSTRRNNEHEK